MALAASSPPNATPGPQTIEPPRAAPAARNPRRLSPPPPAPSAPWSAAMPAAYPLDRGYAAGSIRPGAWSREQTARPAARSETPKQNTSSSPLNHPGAELDPLGGEDERRRDGGDREGVVEQHKPVRVGAPPGQVERLVDREEQTVAHVHALGAAAKRFAPSRAPRSRPPAPARPSRGRSRGSPSARTVDEVGADRRAANGIQFFSWRPGSGPGSTADALDLRAVERQQHDLADGRPGSGPARSPTRTSDRPRERGGSPRSPRPATGGGVGPAAVSRMGSMPVSWRSRSR